MAMHRRAAPLEPPVELMVFDAAKWPAADGVSGFRRWQLARLEWVKQHPDESVLGDVLDVIEAHVRMKRDYWASLSTTL
jgi:hypothetical protein